MGVLGELLARRVDAPREEGVQTAATIRLGKIARAKEPLAQIPHQEAVAEFLGKGSARIRGPLEASSDPSGNLVAGVRLHPFVEALHRAFYDHRPLVLTPDSVWLLVAQGLADHINANAERLRPTLVRHTDQLLLRVRRDDFHIGAPSNPWTEVLDAFTAQIRDHLGADTHELLLPAFSTTTETSMAVAQIVLMGSVKTYFSFHLDTFCGIPEIILEGTTRDWEGVASRARSLEQFDLGWWTRVLVPILEEFVAATRGNANVAFWRCLYKREQMSGGPYVDGWINAFFPYVLGDRVGEPRTRSRIFGHDRINTPTFWCDDEQKEGRPGAVGTAARVFDTATTARLPTGLARCPFTWNCLLQVIPMEFVAGFVGVRQCTKTLRLQPEIGWAVRPA
jgi:hypothetical protein